MLARFTTILAVCAISALSAVGSRAAPKDAEPAVKIVAPADGAVVSRVEDLEGEIAEGITGWPVALVRPVDRFGNDWWVQPTIKQVKNRKFTGRVYFGEQDTRDGTKFRIVVLLAPNEEEAKKQVEGTKRQELPAGLPQSEVVTVNLGKKAAEKKRVSSDSPAVKEAQKPAKKKRKAVKPRMISFSGLEWEVKRGPLLGPGPNPFSDAEENVRVDQQGQLHLAVTHRDGAWQCAEVIGPSLGYGEYRWVVAGDLAAMDPQFVLGLFTYLDNQHEIDFELSRWGDADKPNAQFVVQPHGKDSMYRFDTGKASLLTCSFLWAEKLVRGRCWIGEDTSGKPLAEWEYTGAKVPEPGGERVRSNLWLFRGQLPTVERPQEVVIRSFRFTPSPPRAQNRWPP